MSMDFSVYLKQAKPDPAGFERYAGEKGFQVKIHPEVDLASSTGFCPFCLTDSRFAEEEDANAFVTGFELYQDDFEPEDYEDRPEEGSIDAAVKGSSDVLSLCCGGEDSFEVLMACLFGAYCVRDCGAVFEDPQSGDFYSDAKELESEIERIVGELLEEKEAGELMTHEFEGWE